MECLFYLLIGAGCGPALAPVIAEIESRRPEVEVVSLQIVERDYSARPGDPIGSHFVEFQGTARMREPTFKQIYPSQGGPDGGWVGSCGLSDWPEEHLSAEVFERQVDAGAIVQIKGDLGGRWVHDAWDFGSSKITLSDDRGRIGGNRGVIFDIGPDSLVLGDPAFERFCATLREGR